MATFHAASGAVVLSCILSALAYPTAVADGYVELESTTVYQAVPGVALGSRNLPMPMTSEQTVCTGGSTVRVCYPMYEFEGFSTQEVPSPIVTQETRAIPFYYVHAWSPATVGVACASSGNAWTLALVTRTDTNGDHVYEGVRTDTVALPATWYGAYVGRYACAHTSGESTPEQLLP